MIKSFPVIYPNESFYSYLSRLFCHSGYIWSVGITSEMFKRPNEYINFNFVNVLNEDFRNKLFEYIKFEEIILNHTLSKHYLRFLPKEKKEEVFYRLLNNETSIYRYLPIPANKDNYFLKYCPACVIEDRKKYGEAYFHIEHQIYEVCCCTEHKCKLINTKIPNNQSRDSSLIPLENLITALTVDEVNDFVLGINKYIVDVFNKPLVFDDDVEIGKYLVSRLDEKYISPRGGQKDLTKILVDLKNYYKNYSDFDITKGRLATIYRDEYLNVFDVLLIAYFERISVDELCGKKEKIKDRTKNFDERVKYLYKSGKNKLQIASIMGVDKEVVRQILLGTYDKPKNAKPRFRSKKWDWKKIDSDSCLKLDEWINKNELPYPLTKKVVSIKLGLKDKSLRNLPNLKEKIKKIKK